MARYARFIPLFVWLYLFSAPKYMNSPTEMELVRIWIPESSLPSNQSGIGISLHCDSVAVPSDSCATYLYQRNPANHVFKLLLTVLRYLEVVSRRYIEFHLQQGILNGIRSIVFRTLRSSTQLSPIRHNHNLRENTQ